MGKKQTPMILRKFSLMDPDEFDRYEELQQTEYRPASLKDTPAVAARLLALLQQGARVKGGSPEEKLDVRITNRLKSNAHIRSLGTKEQFLELVSQTDANTLMGALVLDLLKLDTNKGNYYQEQCTAYLFQDGAKATEKEAKQRLIQEHALDPDQFRLLPDAGPDAIYIDERNHCLVRAGDREQRMEGRSIDAITELPGCYIAWVMKYAGGTAGVDGSGQKDQKTSEGIKYSKIFESALNQGTEITYKDLPVFMAYLVYGSQFTNNSKRIVENELGFKRDLTPKRSFNISINRVKAVIDHLAAAEDFSSVLDDIYQQLGYDIEYTGRPKKLELERLRQWL